MDDAWLVRTVDALLARDERAWSTLVTELHPEIERLVRGSAAFGPLRGFEDHVRSAATAVISKLARNDYRALSLLEPWLAAHPGKTAGDWLRIVVANVVREYVARQIGSDATKRLLHTLASPMPEDDASPGLRPPVTNQQTAREILEYAAEHLPPEQLSALDAWLRQVDFAEIGRAANLDARGGEKLVRAALATLRRQFAA